MTSEPDSPKVPYYRRAVLKLSGESFARAGERGISMEEVVDIARQVHVAQNLGCELAIVIGGGNILRGAQFTLGNVGIQEATAHYMGMLATVINGLALQDALESLGSVTRLMTAIKMDGVAEPYIRRRARRHLEKGRIIILAAGTGSPFVTTDTAAVQRLGNRSTNRSESHPRRRRLQRRSRKESARRTLSGVGLQRSARTQSARDGPHGNCTVYGA